MLLPQSQAARLHVQDVSFPADSVITICAWRWDCQEDDSLYYGFGGLRLLGLVLLTNKKTIMAVRRSMAARRYDIRQRGVAWREIDDGMSNTRNDFRGRVVTYLRQRSPSARMGLSAG